LNLAQDFRKVSLTQLARSARAACESGQPEQRLGLPILLAVSIGARRVRFESGHCVRTVVSIVQHA